MKQKRARLTVFHRQLINVVPDYKRRFEALEKAPEQIPDMIKRAVNAGIDASYMLMDT